MTPHPPTLYFLSLLCLVIFCSACSYSTYSGTLVKKPWSKSTQSYCAQGSDYFVLQNGEDEFVIRHKSGDKLNMYKDQKVVIKGKMEEISIEPSNTDLPSQVPDIGPMGQAFTCTVLIARKIKSQ